MSGYAYGFGASEAPQADNKFGINDQMAKYGGINFRYLELNKQKVKWQVVTIPITGPSARFVINDKTLDTNDYVVGVVITTDDIFDSEGNVKLDAQKCINDSSISLTIDGETLFPSDFACELITQKQGRTMYECAYPCFERAHGSQIEGFIQSSGNLFTGPFSVKLHLCCIKSDDKK